MARIGIDASSVAPGGKGHARTQRETVAGLARLGHEHELVAFVGSADAAAVLRPTGVRAVVAAQRPAVRWEQIGLARLSAANGLDAVLTWTERLPILGAGRFVVWLFESPLHRIDESRRAGAGWYQRGSDEVTRRLWKRSLRRAAHVAMGSQATADEVLSALPELQGRVSVVHPGLSDGFAPGPGRDDGPYVFHLGSSDPRDNSETVVAAFAAALPRLSRPARLVVAGDLGSRRERLEAAARAAGVAEALELPGRVSDPELADLYRGAAAYVDPTLYEGFGYGVLEAMASGAPVIASERTSIPEVVGDAGLLCDPRSADAFAEALVRVLEDGELAAELRRRGLERARAFTWERTARGLLTAIEAALAR